MTGKVEKKKGFSVAKNGLLKRCISGCFWLIYGRRVGTKKSQKQGWILQSRSSKMKKVKKNERFLQKNGTFSVEYLVKSEKSSTFACFFAARVREHNARECENNN